MALLGIFALAVLFAVLYLRARSEGATEFAAEPELEIVPAFQWPPREPGCEASVEFGRRAA